MRRCAGAVDAAGPACRARRRPGSVPAVARAAGGRRRRARPRDRGLDRATRGRGACCRGRAHRGHRLPHAGCADTARDHGGGGCSNRVEHRRRQPDRARAARGSARAGDLGSRSWPARRRGTRRDGGRRTGCRRARRARTVPVDARGSGRRGRGGTARQRRPGPALRAPARPGPPSRRAAGAGKAGRRPRPLVPRSGWFMDEQYGVRP